jgi:GAF domain-containing protein
VPRISIPGFTEPAPIRRAPSPDDPINAARLAQRLAALASALDDLPGQAKRFARWRARRDLAVKTRRAHRFSPLRPGPAHGVRRPHSRRRAHEVDEVLRDLPYFAHCALERPDTS